MTSRKQPHDAAAALPARGLYPTVAISDAFNTVTHALAAIALAQLAPTSAHRADLAAVGFASVAFAATLGTLRFGLSEYHFAAVNGATAHFAAYVGLPLVGFAAATSSALSNGPQSSWCAPLTSVLSNVDPALFTVALSWICLLSTNTFAAALEDLVKVLLNVVLFIWPVAALGLHHSDRALLAYLGLFVFAGVVIKPEREKLLFGVRRENWFHYGIGIASMGMAYRLAAILAGGGK